MITYIIILFIIGYLCIALEHPLKVDKTATALTLGMLMWVLYAVGADTIVPDIAGAKFQQYVSENPSLYQQGENKQALSYVCNVDLVEHLGDIAQTVLFLLGAMTIVELIDVHDGFTVITSRIHTRKRRKLLWIMTWLTFFLSAVLDNLTTTIVMLTLLRKFVPHKRERWIYAGTIILAANSGGAWSPIGDVTTIMLWNKGLVTAAGVIMEIFIPSLISMLVPAYILSRSLHGKLEVKDFSQNERVDNPLTETQRKTVFFLGVGGLVFVPVFKTITHLPPFVGILLILGILWTITEIFYANLALPEETGGMQKRVTNMLSRIDMGTILFFLGILMAVACLETIGALELLGEGLNTTFNGNHYLVTGIIGVLSSIVDNVPLVAGCMGMYPVAATGDMAIDGIFWQLLAYCAGVGGSMLIIGSAAGVVVMGLEKISFGWYMKKITWIAFVGYLAGILIYWAERSIFF